MLAWEGYTGNLISALVAVAEHVEALDIGPCGGVTFQGTASADWTDAVPCEADAVVILHEGDWLGIPLCGRCYRKYQKEAV